MPRAFTMPRASHSACSIGSAGQSLHVRKGSAASANAQSAGERSTNVGSQCTARIRRHQRTSALAMAETIDCAVIGAGVVGLAVGRKLAMSGREVVVLEAEEHFGTHTSSRNSEVMHAGIYYPTGSLKARLCFAGRKALYRYCAEHGVNHRRIGKVIVACDESELTGLAEVSRAGGHQRLRRSAHAERGRARRHGAGSALRRGLSFAFDRHHRRARTHARLPRRHGSAFGRARARESRALRKSHDGRFPARGRRRRADGAPLPVAS